MGLQVSSFDCEQLVAVELIKRGEFVRRKEGAKKVYMRTGYDQATKRYALVDCDDLNKEIFIKKGAKLFVGFTY